MVGFFSILFNVAEYAIVNISSVGQVAEWLCRGLQILVCRFDSGLGLQVRVQLESFGF